jgi:hypothetical protein
VVVEEGDQRRDMSITLLDHCNKQSEGVGDETRNYKVYVQMCMSK